MKGLEEIRKEIPSALRHGAGPYVLVIDAKRAWEEGVRRKEKMMKLQPLRIPPGWEVVLNKFLEWDVEDWAAQNENWLDLTEDMAYFRKKGRRHEVGIDLGWYPDTAQPAVKVTSPQATV